MILYSILICVSCYTCDYNLILVEVLRCCKKGHIYVLQADEAHCSHEDFDRQLERRNGDEPQVTDLVNWTLIRRTKVYTRIPGDFRPPFFVNFALRKDKRMQKKSPNVAMRFSSEDKSRLKELSKRLQMSQTETVRILVRQKLERLNLKSK
jgi:hypothetical protein